MRRWLLWNLRCLRGRRCARLTIDAIEPAELPALAVVQLDYTCGGCKTNYLLEAFTVDGELVELNRERRP